ncbi:unnamed protein product [Hymenolepis diminuta]|uniref:Uncharacterized protein n=1 Tax=Hymenolepis diminuta TaxID=6216 RepID=A0A564YPE9_HYMDI|nr:unnamed protein product [Hymenolepis diminuta]
MLLCVNTQVLIRLVLSPKLSDVSSLVVDGRHQFKCLCTCIQSDRMWYCSGDLIAGQSSLIARC